MEKITKKNVRCITDLCELMCLNCNFHPGPTRTSANKILLVE